MRRFYVGGLSVLLSAAISLNSFAAGWYQENTAWKYQMADNSDIKNGWQWLDGNLDGVAECYYFDQYGRAAVGTKTPDGHQVDETGAWIKDGKRQTRETGVLFGKWETDGKTWRFQKADGTYISGGWHWIDGNADGIAECYYFGTDGKLLVNSVTPDGYTVNKDGAWIDGNQVVKKYSDGRGMVPAKTAGTSSSDSSGSSGGNHKTPEESVTIDDIENIENLKVGSAKRITLRVRPEGAGISAESTNEEVADVTLDGKVLVVTGKSAGIANVKVTAVHGSKSAEKTFRVTVKADIPKPDSDAIILYNSEQGAAPIVMGTEYCASEDNPYAQRDYSQVARAVSDLRQDIAMVNGAIDYQEIQQIFVDDEDLQEKRLQAANAGMVPDVLYDTNLSEAGIDNAVIVGIIGESPIIDEMITAGKLDEATDIAGSREAYVIKSVENPIEGVENALVIAGSDARGTIFGIYSISEEIGVSPFYWYSDVPVVQQDEIEVDYREALVNNGPAVKYRGIFINDEDISITSWARYKFPTVDGTPDVNYYRHVFELLLRLKGNFMWPAMHEVTTSFNVAKDDDGIPINAQEASKYGIVMGSTHCDILLRTNTGEWYSWVNENKDKYGGSISYDFTTHKEAILQYWRERLETNKDFESILTLGIRGVHDGAFSCALLKEKYNNSKVELMEDVIREQRKLIAEVYFDGDISRVSEIPQVLIPYKEMADVYNDGLDKFLAQPEYEDITLMWAEDNHGYVRQTPNDVEKERSGGAGIYYHASYYGSPTSWLWLNSIPLAQLSEQLHRAYDEQMRDQWILNVGDIKPGDHSTEFFMKMAWDPETYNDKTIESEYLVKQAIRDYGLSEEDAQTVAAAMMEYNKMANTKKPEYYLQYTTAFDFSATSNGDEALLWLERSQWVVDQLTPIYEQLEEATQSAFYQQLYYHALSANDAAKEYVYYWKAKQASLQGRTVSTKIYNELSKEARDAIKNRVDDYNSLNNNKWAGYMSWKHVTGSESDNHDILQDSEYPKVPEEKTGVGAAAEGQTLAGNGTLRLNSAFADDMRYFDVFSRQSSATGWVAEAPEWVKLSLSSGVTATEQRVIVMADWDNIDGFKTGKVKVYNALDGKKNGEAVAEFTVEVTKNAVEFGETKGFIEANGYVAIEAEHYSDIQDGSDGSSWGVIKNYGQHGNTMKAFPDHNTSTFANGAKLIYNVYFDNAGTYSGTLNRLPTLNESIKSCNVMIGVNGKTGTTLEGNAHWSGSWSNNVQRMYEPLNFSITVNQGWNTIEITRLDPSIVIDRFVIETVGGALSESLLGPVESPNNIAEGDEKQPVRIAELPRKVLDAKTFTDMKLTAGEGASAYEGLENAKKATSTEKRVATVEVEDGIIFVTPLRVGTTTVNVKTGEEEDASFEVRVMPSTAETGAFLEEDGRVVIDAGVILEDSEYAFATGPDDHEWILSGIGISDTPDTGKNWTATGINSLKGIAPALHYQVDISETREYYLYVNTSHPDFNSDSYHVAVDDEYCYFDKSEQNGKETWYSAKEKIELEKGIHTLTIYAREDGFLINQLLLSTKNNESLSGLQKASQRSQASTEAGTIEIDELDDFIMEEGDEEEIIVTASASNASQVTLSAKSANKKVAEVEEVEEGIFNISAVGEGRAMITITATASGCKNVTSSFMVTVGSGSVSTDDLAYQANNSGKIIINAVDALLDSDYAFYSDEDSKYNDVSFAWKAVEDGESLQLTPVSVVSEGNKWLWIDTENYDVAPMVSFKVYVEEEGEYYWSFFANSPNLATDSYHLVVNDEYQYQTGDSSKGTGDAVGSNWFTCKNTVFLEAGENIISIYGRESGLLLRQLMLSKEKPASLSGWISTSGAEPISEEESEAEKQNILPEDMLNENKNGQAVDEKLGEADGKTDGAEEKPDDTDEKPDDTEEKPDDTEEKPDDTEEKPDDTEEKLDDTEEKSDDTEEKLDDTSEKPDSTDGESENADGKRGDTDGKSDGADEIKNDIENAPQ